MGGVAGVASNNASFQSVVPQAPNNSNNASFASVHYQNQLQQQHESHRKRKLVPEVNTNAASSSTAPLTSANNSPPDLNKAFSSRTPLTVGSDSIDRSISYRSRDGGDDINSGP